MRHWAIDPSNNNEENTQYERHRGWKRYSFQEGHKNILTFFFFNDVKSDRERILKRETSDKRSYEREISIYIKKEQSPDLREFQIEEAQNAIQKKAERSLCCHANCSDYFIAVIAQWMCVMINVLSRES